MVIGGEMLDQRESQWPKRKVVRALVTYCLLFVCLCGRYGMEHFGNASKACRLCRSGESRYVLIRWQKVSTHSSLQGRGTWNCVVICVERIVLREGSEEWGNCGGGEDGLSVCVLMHSGHGDEIRTKVRQGVQIHLLKAVRKLWGGNSPWERWVEVMCVNRVVLEKLMFVGCVGQEG